MDPLMFFFFFWSSSTSVANKNAARLFFCEAPGLQNFT